MGKQRPRGAGYFTTLILLAVLFLGAVAPHAAAAASPATIITAQATGSVITVSGTQLMKDGAPIQLFGADDQYVFLYAEMASGQWGPADSSAWGKNELFPNVLNQISGVSDIDGHWREYFRYFLHYQQTAGAAGHPKPNMLRIWLADDSWYSGGLYNAWNSDPTTFWSVMDKMVYWAGRANVYLVPVFGQFCHCGGEDFSFFDPASTNFAHQVAVTQAIMDRYATNSTIAMWDLWNEPDADAAAWSGIVPFTAWATAYINAVKPHAGHPISIGFGGWTGFPGAPPWPSQAFWDFFNALPVDVSSHHSYWTGAWQTGIDAMTSYMTKLNKPHIEGEFAYYASPGLNPWGYGYYPWYAQAAQTAGWAAISAYFFADNGQGVYADYPFTGTLPDYPAASPPPPTPIPIPANAFRGRYYGDETFTTLLVERLDNTINFTWGTGSPPAIPVDSFSVRWEGRWDFEAGSYTFSMTADDGIRFWLDNVSVLDAWVIQASTTYIRNVTVNAGQHDVRVDYFEHTGDATVKVSWTDPPATPPLPPPPTDPPRITDLTIIAKGRTWVTLQWTALDNGAGNRAKWYDFRVSTTAITNANFYSARHVDLPFFPHTPGQGEGVTIVGLAGYTVYYFAVKLSDDVPNWSNTSNSPGVRTLFSGSDIADPMLDIISSPVILLTFAGLACGLIGAEIYTRRKYGQPDYLDTFGQFLEKERRRDA